MSSPLLLKTRETLRGSTELGGALEELNDLLVAALAGDVLCCQALALGLCGASNAAAFTPSATIVERW